MFYSRMIKIWHHSGYITWPKVQITTRLVYISLEMKHQMGELDGNILVHTNCMDITMAWKTSCKDVATRAGSFALHIIFWLGLGGGATAPSNDAPVWETERKRVELLSSILPWQHLISGLQEVTRLLVHSYGYVGWSNPTTTQANLGHFRGNLHSQSLDWYWQIQQYRKIHKLNTTTASRWHYW